MTKCFFNDCDNDVVPGLWKCEFHKNRGKCLAGDCQNQVYARSLCVRHGGKRQCQAADCTSNVRIGDFCSRHGAVSRKKRCNEPGCDKVAHARQKCVRHGGGRKCKVDGCDTHARIGGLCCRHGTTKDSGPVDESMKTEQLFVVTDLPRMCMLTKHLVPESPCSVSGFVMGLESTVVVPEVMPSQLFSLSLEDDWTISSDDKQDSMFELNRATSDALDGNILDDLFLDDLIPPPHFV
ncbi:Aste57867_271 [Aphanomyces stellatus]|uniref:Aste57867_271 protein n=1 Tax=Aphanomyces stellatus TaxID=120398 RepID=A0A485K263_9STRA|nr:hypothetical protein As57867_000271 [Aphanomyces stellatus]VFT77497.1 Aste57867_271 [Aphanomyces stellatus]